MNSTVPTTDTTPSEIFIPMLPGRRKRFAMMVSSAIPGVVLFMSALSSSNETMALSALKFFSCIAGLLVVVASVREFIKPGSYKLMGVDTITVFTGFLIIALGANMYNAYKGFQPAHGYFLAGFITIFKGVMVPESKIKRGFTITENEISYNQSFFSRMKKLPVDELTNVEYKSDQIWFRYSNNSELSVSVRNAANGSEMAESLKKFLLMG